MLDEFRSTNITWDKATSRIYSPVTANASDENGRKLVVQIVNSGQVEDLTGATLHLYWETRDKAHDGLDVFDAVDLEKGEFELSYTTGMLSNHGVLNANLVLIDTVGRVVSERFKITVTEGIDNDAIQSENSFSSLTKALIDVSNLEQNYAPRLNDLTAQLQQKAQQTDLEVTDARIDGLIANAGDGTTPSELTDLRIATDGYTHTVAKNAISYELKDIQENIFTALVSPVMNVGYFISSTGSIVENATYGYSKPLFVKKGQTIKVRAFGVVNNTAIIASCDSEGNILSVIQLSTESNMKEYAYTPEKDMYVSVSGSISTRDIFVRINTPLAKKDELETLNSEMIALSSALSIATGFNVIDPTKNYGYFVDKTGSIVSNTTNYFYTDPIFLSSNDTVILQARGYLSNVAIVATCDEFGNNITPVVLSVDSVSREYRYTASSETYVIVSSHVDNFNFIKSKRTSSDDEEIDYSLLFERGIAIGDSLTEGDNGDEIITTNYPYFISKMTGWNVNNKGRSGYTTTQYWHGMMLEDYSQYEFAIIFLGQNAGLTDTLIADTTISSGQSYLDYADTNTGNYCKIIEKIKETAPNIKLFLCTVPRNAGSDKTIRNKVIKQIAEKYDGFVVDVYEETVMSPSNADIYQSVDGIHYNKLGYLTLASEILKLIKQNISDNKLRFIN